jgi:hypothetical protein
MSLYGQPSLNPNVFPSVKLSTKTYMSSHNFFFFFVFYIPFGIPSVYTDGLFLSLYTDSFSDGKNIVSKYHCKIPMKKTFGNFSCIYRISGGGVISKAFKTKLLNA